VVPFILYSYGAVPAVAVIVMDPLLFPQLALVLVKLIGSVGIEMVTLVVLIQPPASLRLLPLLLQADW
jgi:hypothetical protein